MEINNQKTPFDLFISRKMMQIPTKNSEKFRRKRVPPGRYTRVSRLPSPHGVWGY